MGRCVYTGIYEPGHPSADADGFRTDVADLVRELGVDPAALPRRQLRLQLPLGGRRRPARRPAAPRSTWPGAAWRPTRSAPTTSCSGASGPACRAMLAVNLGTRGLVEAVELLAVRQRRAGTPARRPAGQERRRSSRTRSAPGASATRWTAPGRSATRPPRSTPGWPRRPRARCSCVDPTLELVACGISNSRDADLRHLGARGAGALLRRGRPHLRARLLRAADGDYASFLASAVDMERFIDAVVATADHVAAVRRSPKRITVSFDEWNVWFQPSLRRRGPLDIAEAPRADRGRLRRHRRGRRRQPADHPAPAHRPGGDRLPGPAGQRDRPDPDRAGRPRLAADDLPPVRADRPARPGHGAADPADRPDDRPPPATATSTRCDSVATWDEETGAPHRLRGQPLADRADRLELDLDRCPPATARADRAPDARRGRPDPDQHHGPPDRVVPAAGRRSTGGRDGSLTSQLPPVSWHCIRLTEGNPEEHRMTNHVPQPPPLPRPRPSASAPRPRRWPDRLRAGIGQRARRGSADPSGDGGAAATTGPRSPSTSGTASPAATGRS